jgi:hypothetical protein
VWIGGEEELMEEEEKSSVGEGEFILLVGRGEGGVKVQVPR